MKGTDYLDMRYFISDGNITLEPDTTNYLDMTYINQVKPYKYNKTQYKLPITKSAIIKLRDTFNLQSQQLNNILVSLDTAMMFNKIELSKSSVDYLRPYQEQGVKWIEFRLKTAKALGLFWAMRTGKTRTTAIATRDYNKIIVLTLSGQEANWVSTYNEFTDKTIINLHKKTPSNRDLAYYLFNTTDNVVLVASMTTITNDILSGKFECRDYDMLVVDEIHKARNTKTQLHKGIKELRKHASYCLGLTGTPVSKNLNEMLPLFSLLWPNRFNKTYLSNYFFNQEYNAFSSYGTAGELKPEKMTEWFEFMALYFNQVTKEQALPWAKEPLKQTIRLMMNGEQEKLYERCLTKFELPLGNGKVKQIQEVIAQMSYLQQLSTNPQLINENYKSGVKQEWLLEFLENYTGDGVIIFSTHTTYLNMLYKTLSKHYKTCLITGETKNKTDVANAFQNGVYDIVLANIQAGSKGLTLDRADTMIFLDEDWRPDENLQAIERFTATTPDRIKLRQVYRLEIENKFEFNGVMINSIDYYVNQVVNNKISQTELVNRFKEIFMRM